MSLNIVFVEPEIPPNTGNIARTCAATDTTLHLVKPLGFSIDDKHLKRAGLDYKDERMWLATTKGENLYTEAAYQDGDFILFGRETKGLPRDFIDENKEKTIRIPMSENTRTRSFNLANSANIILFEALRQLGFPGLK